MGETGLNGPVRVGPIRIRAEAPLPSVPTTTRARVHALPGVEGEPDALLGEAVVVVLGLPVRRRVAVDRQRSQVVVLALVALGVVRAGAGER